MRATLLALTILVSACGYNSTHTVEDPSGGFAGGPGKSGGGGTGGGTAVDFAAVKAQVFQPFCVRCHSAASGNAAGVNLETFASVKPNAARIKGAVDSGFMPKGGTLPASAKGVLNAWILAGSPEFAATAPGTGPTPNPGGNPMPDPNPGPNPIPCEDDDAHLTSNEMVQINGAYFLNTTTNTITRHGHDHDCGGHHHQTEGEVK